MNDVDKKLINEKLEEIGKYLKIDSGEKDWRRRINKELKETKFSYLIYRVFGSIIMGGAGIIMIIAFFMKGETIFGIEIKENYFHLSMTIVLISFMFSIGGKSELKLDRIKTFILLHDIDNE